MPSPFRPGRTLAVIVLVAAAACGGHLPPPAAIDSLIVSKEEPPSDAVHIAGVQAVDGSGCGITGTGGSYEGALRKLRIRAQALGADFIHLPSVKEPYHDRQCAHREFSVAGVAYRVRASEPAAPAAQPSSVSLVAPARSAETKPEVQLGPALRVGREGCTLHAPNAPQPASLTVTARLTAPAFAISIDQSQTDAAPNGFVLRYDRASRRLELERSPAGSVLSIAAEPLDVDAAPHTWRIVRSSDEINVFFDAKRVLVVLVPAPAPESTFRIEPDQLEILRLSP
jgi:hypothetical protein